MSNVREGAGTLFETPIPPAEFNLDDSGLPMGEELKILRQENVSLRAKVEELENLVVLASQEAEERCAACKRECDSLIEVKTEVIRELHQKNAELRDKAPAAGAAPVAGAPVEAVADRAELLKLQRQLEEQRQQMEDDEESMMTQLRQMELTLAKDRAELARQRAELQRLHDEVKHDQDVASRDGGLRERLGALQRRSTDFALPRPKLPQQDVPTTQPIPNPPTPSSANATKSGIFRRIFGAG